MPVPLRRFSQNWLVNDELAEALVRAVAPLPGERFLEIGPGEGRLTRALLAHEVEVTAVELDPRCCEALGDIGEDSPGRLTVIRQDILRFDPSEAGGRADPRRPGDGRLRFVGNLPYAVASPILRWTVKQHGHVLDVHYMVPADVATRMLAPPGSSERALLSVLVGWFFDGAIVRKLGPGAFRPAPKIDSAFVRLQPRVPPSCTASGPHRRAVVQGAFAHRRKTMVNSLRQSGWRRADIDEALEAAGIDASARAETVDVEHFARLAEALPELAP